MIKIYNDYYGMYFILILSLVITIGSQIFISVKYKSTKRIKTLKGYTGRDVARKILDKNGLSHVKVVETSGELTDHYDPTSKVVRLSTEIYNGSSIASASVAAHECGHAIQDKDNYLFLRIRSSLVPITNFATNAGYFIIMFGFIFSMMKLVVIGIILDVIILLFQVITLPVEFNASYRALIQLKELDLVDSNEQSKCRGMLVAAALTYVAAVATAILEILRLVLILRNDDDR